MKGASADLFPGTSVSVFDLAQELRAGDHLPGRPANVELRIELNGRDMILCTGCGKALGRSEGTPAAASISGSIMGDEQIDSYYLCPSCGLYTVEVCDDRFCGEETISFRGPLTRDEGEKWVALIRECSEPWDKKCRCPAHREYFGSWLD